MIKSYSRLICPRIKENNDKVVLRMVVPCAPRYCMHSGLGVRVCKGRVSDMRLKP